MLEKDIVCGSTGFPHTLDRIESAAIVGSLVSKIFAGRYGTGAARAVGARGEEIAVGRSAPRAAVGLAEAAVTILMAESPEESPAP